jgi:DNA-binding transcriptional regulator YiaG
MWLMTKRRRPAWRRDDIKRLRAHLGMTQQELADEMGTRQQTISEWETGMYRPRGASVTLLNLVAERAGFHYGEAPEDEEDGR